MSRGTLKRLALSTWSLHGMPLPAFSNGQVALPELPLYGCPGLLALRVPAQEQDLVECIEWPSESSSPMPARCGPPTPDTTYHIGHNLCRSPHSLNAYGKRIERRLVGGRCRNKMHHVEGTVTFCSSSLEVSQTMLECSGMLGVAFFNLQSVEAVGVVCWGDCNPRIPGVGIAYATLMPMGPGAS